MFIVRCPCAKGSVYKVICREMIIIFFPSHSLTLSISPLFTQRTTNWTMKPICSKLNSNFHMNEYWSTSILGIHYDNDRWFYVFSKWIIIIVRLALKFDGFLEYFRINFISKLKCNILIDMANLWEYSRFFVIAATPPQYYGILFSFFGKVFIRILLIKWIKLIRPAGVFDRMKKWKSKSKSKSRKLLGIFSFQSQNLSFDTKNVHIMCYTYIQSTKTQFNVRLPAAMIKVIPKKFKKF